MVDFEAVLEADEEINRSDKLLQGYLETAATLNLRSEIASVGKRLSSDGRAFIKSLPSPQEMKAQKHVLMCALKEKTTAEFIAHCFNSVVFPTSVYNMQLPKTAFLEKTFAKLTKDGLVSTLAAYRALQHIGEYESFVPPVGPIVDAMRAEEAGLEATLKRFVRFRPLHEQLARIDVS